MRADIGPRHPQLDRKTAGDAENQRRDDRFDVAEAAMSAGTARGTRRCAVRQTPQSSGMPNSSCSAMAAPSTSARSQAAMAISQSDPEDERRPARVRVAAGLRQIAAAGDAQPRGRATAAESP